MVSIVFNIFIVFYMVFIVFHMVFIFIYMVFLVLYVFFGGVHCFLYCFMCFGGRVPAIPGRLAVNVASRFECVSVYLFFDAP